MTAKVTMADFLREAIRRELARMRVAIPGRVESYDAKKNRANVKPMIKEPRIVDGERVVMETAVVNNVPVMLDRRGGFSVTAPLAKGDDVTLVFSDRALARFLANGEYLDPGDDRMHDLNDAIAFPGLADFGHPPPDLADDHMSIGAETQPGATSPALRVHFLREYIGIGSVNPPHYVALAARVAEELVALRDTVNALVLAHNGHKHFVATAGSASAQTGTSAVPDAQAELPAAVGNVASSRIKVED